MFLLQRNYFVTTLLNESGTYGRESVEKNSRNKLEIEQKRIQKQQLSLSECKISQHTLFIEI